VITFSAAGAAAAQSAVIQATRAAGVIVGVAPDDFLGVVHVNEEPLVVHAVGGFFRTTHQYLTSFRGLAFHTRSRERLELPDHCVVVEAKQIWIPGQL
jgi:hypothetical protein